LGVLPKAYDLATDRIMQALAKGDEVWSYNALVQDPYSPKWGIEFAPINLRIQPGFISQSLGLTGLLGWSVDTWTSDPWTNVNNAGKFGRANYPGEGMLVYPGSTVGIVGVAPSMRLKWIRDGVEDYEYVALLKKAGRGEWALQVARRVGQDWKTWTRDPNALEATRRQLGEMLDRLASGGSSGGTSVDHPHRP
jgi:glycosyl hydrolase family 123